MNKKNLIIFAIFFIFKTIGTLVIAFAPSVVPYLGFFPYKDQILNYGLPAWASSLANFDGIHYLLIAKNGYSQYEQAFFPFYPFLIKILTPIFFNNGLVAGLVISNLFFLMGLFFVAKLVDSKKSFWLIILLFTFPTSFFFGAVYNEGLFFFLFVAGIYYLRKRNYFLSALFAFLASMTRLIGLFILIPILLHWWFVDRSKKIVATIAAPIIGLASYCYYLWLTTGDPFYFFSSQPAFGANRSTHIIFLPQVIWRYLKIFTTAQPDFRYFISVLEFVMFNLVFVVLVLDLLKNLKFSKGTMPKVINYDRLGLNLFSFANIILPTLTGTLSSIPRYALMSISFFIYLTEIRNWWIKMVIAIVFLIFHIVLAAYFVQGYFIS